eukprot:12223174-Alexandrium_andersonii.AAC.1
MQGVRSLEIVRSRQPHPLPLLPSRGRPMLRLTPNRYQSTGLHVGSDWGVAEGGRGSRRFAKGDEG